MQMKTVKARTDTIGRVSSQGPNTRRASMNPDTKRKRD